VVLSSTFNNKNRTYPGTETTVEIEDILIQNLNLVGLWPISVYRPTRDTTRKNPYASDNTDDDKHFGYILILSCDEGDWKGALDSMGATIMQLKTTSAWNSRGRFIVVAYRCFSNDVQNDLKTILEQVWPLKVFNIIILYLSTNQTVEIYTWYPFQIPFARCGKLPNIIHLDTWVRKQDTGFFSRNATLFAKSTQRDLLGCIFRASTFNFAPFVICDENGIVEGGIDVQVLKIIAEKLNTSLHFRVLPGQNRKGELLSNGTWTGLKGELMYDKTDIAIASFLSNYENHVIFDDTNTYHTAPFTWFVAGARPYPRWLSMGRVFTPSAWLLVLAFIFLVGYCMKCFSRCVISESASEWDIAKCILNVWAAFIEVGVPDMPRQNTLRIMFLSWIVYSLAINTIFQAYFTSYEVDPGLQHQIDTTEELLHTPMFYTFPPQLDPFFSNDMLQRLTPRIRCGPRKCLEYVATLYNATTILSRFLVGYHYDELLEEADRHDIHPFHEDAFQVNSVMLVQKGSPFLTRVNEIIRRIVEAGLSDYWKEAILVDRRIKAKRLALESLKDSYVEMNASHLQGAFIFLLIGTGLSFTAFLVEILLEKISIKCRRNN
jgi:hypothetical protein